MKTFIKEIRKMRGMFMKTVASLLVIVILGMGYACWRHSGRRLCRVAFVAASDKPSHVLMYEGFLRKYQQLKQATTYMIKPCFFSVLDPASISTAVRDVLHANPDIIVACGQRASMACVALESTTPVVCVDVPDYAERLGALAAEKKVSMAVNSVESKKIIAPLVLQSIKPGARQVVIAYNASTDLTGYCARYAAHTQAVLSQLSINSGVLSFDATPERTVALEDALRTADVLMTLEVDPLEEYQSVLRALCHKHAVTFFCGGLCGGAGGAAIMFGGHQQVLGKAAYVCVKEYLEGAARPTSGAITFVNGHRQCIIDTRLFKDEDMQPLYETAIRQRMLRHESLAEFVPNLKILTT